MFRSFILFLILLSLSISLSTAEAKAAVVISEVYYDHPGDDEGHEFVEIYNYSNKSVNLSGWQIRWAGNDFSQRTLDLSGSVPARGHFLIGGDYVLADFGIEPDMIYNFDFQNGGSATDGIRLSDGNGYNDTILYDSPNSNLLPGDSGWDNLSFCPDVSQGHSLGRINLQIDTDIMSDFADLNDPTPVNSAKTNRNTQAQVPEGNTLVALSGGLAGINLAGKILKP